MLSKEAFISMAENSIIFQNGHSSVTSMSHIKIGDESLQCPFCHNHMKPTKVLNIWIQKCNCNRAITLSKRLDRLYDRINEDKATIHDVQLEVKAEGLAILQKHFKEVVVPEIQAKDQKDIEEILSLKSLN